MYVTSDDKSAFDSPFDISNIPVVTREQADAEDRTKKLTATTPTLKAPKVGPNKTPTSGAEAIASANAQAQRYAEELMQIPEMKEFGSVLKSSPIVELTEAETEYVVTVVKHIFKEHVVLQYEVKNTLPDTILENVSVVATPTDDEDLEEVFIIQSESLATNVPGKVYVAFKKLNGEGSLPITAFSNVLKFTSKEIDPSTSEPEETGYDDEYEVSEFDLSGSDYIVPTFASNFNHLWEQIGASGEEAEETLQLSGMKGIAGKHGWFYSIRQLAANKGNRCNGTVGKDIISTTLGWNRRAYQPEHSHSQAAGQEREWRQSGGPRPYGILVQNRSHHKDYSEERGGKCGSTCDCICGIRVGKPALRMIMQLGG